MHFQARQRYHFRRVFVNATTPSRGVTQLSSNASVLSNVWDPVCPVPRPSLMQTELSRKALLEKLILPQKALLEKLFRIFSPLSK